MINNLDYYIQTKYKNNPLWFKEEIEQSYHSNRIAKTFKMINYLHGNHKIKERENVTYKDKELVTKKLILNQAKTICNFHSTYICGNPVSLTGSKSLLEKIQEIYKYGGFYNTDFMLSDKLVKYGNAYEYVYRDNKGNITSKLIQNESAYPVFDERGNYVAFIEYYTNLEHISYFNVYYPDKVDCWSNERENLHIIDTFKNISGLPIIYKTLNDWDYREGEGLLENIIPILDEIEDLLSKMGDSIYMLSLNPLLVGTGQAIEGSIDKNVTGTYVNLENGGELKYVNSVMDYQSIKYYLDTIMNVLNQTAYIPSILGGNGNIANVSETSLKMLYQLADVFALMNEKVLREGMNERINIIRKLIGSEDDKEYVDINFNYARPQNQSELLDNLKKQYDMNSISTETIIEKSNLTNDKVMELDRLKGMNRKSVDKVDDGIE